MENSNLIIYGRNAVLEAINSNKPINTLYVQKSAKGLYEHVSVAKKLGIVVKDVTVEKLNEICGGNSRENFHGIRHGGVAVSLSAVEYSSVGEILALDNSDVTHSAAAFILILDGIEDPHNLGALIRTAEAAGVDGVIIPKRRSAQITSAVYAASAGAAAHMKIARVTNLSDTMKVLKDNGVWIYGAEADGTPYSEIEFCKDDKVALVVGSEGNGLSRLVRENCDFIISVPMHGKINSLNASVCGGILLFHMKGGG